MNSDLNLLQIDDAVVVTSQHCWSRRRRRICRTRHCEHLPEINRLGKHQRFTILNFEITFFLKTDKLKSAFKLRLTSPGRKLLPIFSLLYSQIHKKLINILKHPFINQWHRSTYLCQSDADPVLFQLLVEATASVERHWHVCWRQRWPDRWSERRYFDVFSTSMSATPDRS